VLKKRILFLGILAFALIPVTVKADNSPLRHNRVETLIGTIESKARNSLLIFDEREKTSQRFVFLRRDQERWQKGDRVRVYYRPRDMLITNIKKMRHVERKKEQNAGVIFNADDK
ncbi:MAG: hypothetical protein Q7S13_04305, partial [Candidatus Omnitrophota bacterium]|nr:hypothetical protein [Candidatus Omnitrophota bacterium]